jgi:hypothetical protein
MALLKTLTLLALVLATSAYTGTAPRLLSQHALPRRAASARALWGAPNPARSTHHRLFGGRDLMDVPGLPKSNLMRTNSSAYATLDTFGSSTYDYAKSVQRTMGELAEPDGQLSPLVGKPSANVFSAAALIAGCMIGAGILALPSVTVHSGFMPSSAALAVVWSYCVASGLLIGEVCINSKSSRGAASYLKMAGATVGKGVATVAFALFTVFQYLLLVAYISQGGSLLRNFLEIFQGMDLESVIVHEMDSLGAPVVFASLMGLLLTLGTPKALESVNNAVVLCVVGTFSLLLAAGMQKIDVSLLNHVEVDKLRKWDHSREGIRPSWADRYKAGKMRGVDRMGC